MATGAAKWPRFFGDAELRIQTGLLTSTAALGLLALPAFAAPIQSSVGVQLTFRDCQPVNAPCDGVGTTVSRYFSGEPGDLSTALTQSLAGYGESSVAVSLSGEIGAPILSTRSSSEPGKRVSTNTVAIQRFVYEGPTTAERTFGGNLTYSQTVADPGELSPFGRSGIYARIEVFRLESEFYEVGTTAQDNFAALFLGYEGVAGYTHLARDIWSDYETNLTGSATLAATVIIEPGDVVWVVAILQTPASNGSVIDASRTLITRWDDASGLTPANVARGSIVGVPEPTVLGLIIGGLFLLAFVRRAIP